MEKTFKNKFWNFLFLILSVGCSQTKLPLGTSPAVTGGSTTPQVQLSWNSNLGEQQGFYIEESNDGTLFSQVLVVPDGTNSASVSVPSGGQNYYFRIRGYNQAGTSPYSAPVAVKVVN